MKCKYLLSILILVTIAILSSNFDVPMTEVQANGAVDPQIYEIWNETMSSREYNPVYGRNKYVCSHFSNDFHDILEESNITTYLVLGFYYDDDLAYGRGLHCWIEVNGTQYEPQTGKPVNNNYEFRKYVKRCW